MDDYLSTVMYDFCQVALDRFSGQSYALPMDNRETSMKTTIKTWHGAKGGKLVVGGVEAADMDDARSMAARWNRDAAAGMRVDLVTNGPVPAQSTRVTAVF
jgi:hypothetical protein